MTDAAKYASHAQTSRIQAEQAVIEARAAHHVTQTCLREIHALHEPLTRALRRTVEDMKFCH